MKKLNLKKLNLAKNDLLQREQLKTVFGGYNGECPDDTPVKCKCKDSHVINCKESDKDCEHTCKDAGGVDN